MSIFTCPRGMVDYDPDYFKRLTSIIGVVRQHAQKVGAKEIETPTLELRSTLMDKYGDEAENKLVYHIADPLDGKYKGQKLSLRYDLTVPFCRYVTNRKLTKFTRLQVGKVYRRDRPMKNRWREFIQADIDIIGEYPPLIPEAKIFKVITAVLDDLGLANRYKIRYNFKDNLYAMLAYLKIPHEMYPTVCSSLDKLDKKSWDYVSKELLKKRLNQETIDNLRTAIAGEFCTETTQTQITTLLDYCHRLKCPTQAFLFDPALARGLDYYTGLIYEVIVTHPEPITISAGGRYDRLIKWKTKSGMTYLPAVGVSFGINRIEVSLPPKSTETPELRGIYLIGEISQLSQIMSLMGVLYPLTNHPIDFNDGNRNIRKQISYAIKHNYKYLIILNQSSKKPYTIKTNDHSCDIQVTQDELVKYFSNKNDI